jgi:hypothetical protein
MNSVLAYCNCIYKKRPWENAFGTRALYFKISKMTFKVLKNYEKKSY